MIMIPVRNPYNHSWLPNLFNDIFENDWMPKTNSTAPAINVSETENGYQLEMAAPGMTKDDFKVYLADEDHLVVAIEKKKEEKEEQKKYLRREFAYSKYEQTMILPEDIDREKIQASVNNGILTIDLQKKCMEPQSNEPKMIEIL